MRRWSSFSVWYRKYSTDVTRLKKYFSWISIDNEAFPFGNLPLSFAQSRYTLQCLASCARNTQLQPKSLLRKYSNKRFVTFNVFFLWKKQIIKIKAVPTATAEATQRQRRTPTNHKRYFSLHVVPEAAVESCFYPNTVAAASSNNAFLSLFKCLGLAGRLITVVFSLATKRWEKMHDGNCTFTQNDMHVNIIFLQSVRRSPTTIIRWDHTDMIQRISCK